MNRIAVYPGAFDPATKGHEDIINRSLHFVDRLIVAVAENTTKTSLFSLQERIELLNEIVGDDDRVEIRPFHGLLADFAHEMGAAIVVRGLRAVSDFEYEFQMALMNRKLRDDLETVFLVPARHLTFLSSSIVREVASLGGDVADLVHPTVLRALEGKFG
ncbi:MAG: pantetheine-phosphate adenylyltransferase [Gemmatimonadetes bacterium]|nr:pantetheine-phosphate adenylyltransferase [Gemmatimonadota bacterium]MCH7490388.1 pantetheine-phosphate adenylyltransferase [Gemmatimonadota bacterium]MCH7715485.1 pantetheine-phosphate adenylyltransferase [Gemmatimonadota bacterium]